MIFLWAPLAVIAAAFLYQSVSAARDRRRYPALGRLIDVNGTQLHVRELGQGRPAVVLESGIGASSLSWADIQPQIAAFTRVISYDRAGLGWSARARVPRSVPVMVEELHALLSKIEDSPPYVLVGHSFGGLLVRAYAAAHPLQVAGLVLVDPVSVANWANCSEPDRARLQLGVMLAKRGAWLARFGVVRAALAVLVAGGRWLPKLAARAGGRRGATAVTNIVGEVSNLPAEVWPLVRSHWSDPKCFRALSEYLGCLPESALYASRLAPLRGIPTTILSAASATPGELQERDRWVSESGLGRHIRVPDSGHWLHLEHPDLVIGAVREMVCGDLHN